MTIRSLGGVGALWSRSCIARRTGLPECRHHTRCAKERERVYFTFLLLFATMVLDSPWCFHFLIWASYLRLNLMLALAFAAFLCIRRLVFWIFRLCLLKDPARRRTAHLCASRHRSGHSFFGRVGSFGVGGSTGHRWSLIKTSILQREPSFSLAPSLGFVCTMAVGSAELANITGECKVA